ncbi:MAG: ATP-binding protein [Phycisphaerales bacterium]
MRERHHWMWAIYAACSLALLGVLAWVSSATLSLESREREARADARQQELSRQALWRMDSALAPILAREAARPYFHYQPFYAADRAYTSMLEEVRPGEVLVPSPLLQAPEKFVKLHFQISPRGDFSSPQAPTGTLRDLAKSVAGQTLASDAESELGELRLIWAADRAPRLADANVSAGQRLGSSRGDLGPIASGAAPGAPGESRSTLKEPLRDQAEFQQFQKPGQADYLARRQVAEQAAQSLENNAVLPKETTITELDGSGRPGDAPGEDRIAAAEKKEAPPASGSEGAPPLAPALASAPSETRKAGEAAKDGAPGVSPSGAAPNDAALKDKALAETDSSKNVDDANRERLALGKKVAPGADSRTAKERRDEHVRVPVPIGAIKRDGASIGTPVPVVHGPFAAHWLVGEYGRRELTLVREVRVGDERFTQGVWMDWEQLRPWLLDQTRDLTPTADLRPITLGGDEDPRRLLASIPAELDIGASTLGVGGGGAWSPMMTTIIVAWLASLAAIVAVGLVIRAAAELATRRGRFVSAVTHELRTPLTTLCMYSQMLEGGMVGEESRREYLGSLRRESERLAKIVENVLEFARLGATRRSKRRERVEMRSLLSRVGESLRARVSAAGMGLKVEIEDGVDATLTGDEITIERIVTNLVENACKYGASPAGVVTLRGLVRGSHAIIEVSDEGPGISPVDRDRVFEPFERGHDLETETKQGLGLGLPLARGLARELGGDLRLLDREGRGATFELSLPKSAGH